MLKEKDANNVKEEPVNGGTTKPPKKSPTRVKVDDADARYEEMTLTLADIVRDDDLFRRRLKEDEANIEKLVGLYSDNMIAEEKGKKPLHKIELILVWYDDIHKRYVLLGGCHRLEALRRLGITEFQVRVLYGSEDAAFAAASQDNTKHGKSLKPCDLKYSIKKSLERYGDTKTYDEIAGEVGCVRSYVSKVYRELFGRGKRLAKTGKSEQVQSGTTPPDNVPPDNDAPFTFDEHKEPEKSVEGSDGQSKSYMERVSDDVARLDQTLGQIPEDLSLEERKVALWKVRNVLQRHGRHLRNARTVQDYQANQVAHTASIEETCHDNKATDQLANSLTT